jgi:hypothetical protein
MPTRRWSWLKITALVYLLPTIFLNILVVFVIGRSVLEYFMTGQKIPLIPLSPQKIIVLFIGANSVTPFILFPVTLIVTIIAIKNRKQLDRYDKVRYYLLVYPT